ncbi:MAG: exonuclease domain-containing protein [Arhodomonas sp.]|nr:exonuclease domain-containing protein [Arhodomonas sp.]
MGWWRCRHAADSGTWPAYMEDRAARALSPRLTRFYAAGVPAPETPIGETPLAALDMETTGLDEARHAIVSIGVVPFTLRRILVSGRRYWVLHPSRALEERSVTFHHITHADIEQRAGSVRGAR